MKKIIDDTGKVFGKINIIDLVVIFIFLLGCFGVIYKFNSRATDMNGATSSVSYLVRIKDVRDTSAKFYKKGLKVFDSKTNNYLGRIEDVTVGDYFDYVSDASGKLHVSQKPNKIYIDLEIKSDAVETDQMYLLGGTYELKAGTDIYILTKYADVIGTVLEIY